MRSSTKPRRRRAIIVIGALIAAGLTSQAVTTAPAAADTGELSVVTARNSSDPHVEACGDRGSGWSGLCLFTSNDLGRNGPYYYPMTHTYLYTVDFGLDPSNPNNWRDRGAVLDESQYPWVTGGTQHLWAPTQFQWSGRNYLLVPDVAAANLSNPNDSSWHTASRIGISTANLVTDHYSYQKTYAINEYASDPAFTVDRATNAPYLVYANGDNDTCGGISIARLNAGDPTILDSAPVELSISGLGDVFGISSTCATTAANKHRPNSTPYLEGAELYYLDNATTGASGSGGKYYLVAAVKPEGGSYGKKNEVIVYATAATIGGPYTYQGIIMDASSTEWTNQASFAQFGGRWLIAYHDGTPCTSNDPRGCEVNAPMRQVRMACLTFSSGRINKVVRGNDGFRTCEGSRTVALQARANGKVVDVTGGTLVAEATTVGEATEFEMVNTGGNFYALRSHANGRYVSGHQDSFLSADAVSIGAAQQFHVDSVSGGGVSLYSGESGDHVRVLTDGSLVDEGFRAGYLPSLAFNIIPLSGVVSLKSARDGKYATVSSDGTDMVYATAGSVGQREKFIVAEQTDGLIALKALANNRLVTTELNDGSANLKANRGFVVGDWEKFQLIVNPDGTVSLRARANSKVVTNEHNNSPAGRLVANRDDVSGTWEQFTLTQTS